MRHYPAMLVEAKDTATLNGTPEHALVAFADGSGRRTDAVALRQEAPRRKLGLHTGNHDQTLRLAS